MNKKVLKFLKNNKAYLIITTAVILVYPLINLMVHQTQLTTEQFLIGIPTISLLTMIVMTPFNLLLSDKKIKFRAKTLND